MNNKISSDILSVVIISIDKRGVMKTRKILYIIAGVFNCIVGAVSVVFSLLVLLLSRLVKKMFESSEGLVDNFINEMAEIEEYAHLKDLSSAEAVDYVMKIVYVLCIVFLIIGAIWITFGVLNLLLNSRHERVFSSKRALKHWFVAGSWLLLGLNVANILTTVAVYKKDKNVITEHKLYTAS